MKSWSPRTMSAQVTCKMSVNKEQQRSPDDGRYSNRGTEIKQAQLRTVAARNRLEAFQATCQHLFFWKKKIICLHQVLVVAHRIFSCSIWDLVPRPGIEPQLPALGVKSFGHWTIREVPQLLLTPCQSDRSRMGHLVRQKVSLHVPQSLHISADSSFLP